jgi:hypothetical protein
MNEFSQLCAFLKDERVTCNIYMADVIFSFLHSPVDAEAQ